jgi:hypothetical protein
VAIVMIFGQKVLRGACGIACSSQDDARAVLNGTASTT